MGNQIRTTVLLAAMTALMLLIGRFLGGQQGMIIAFVIAIGMNFFSYWFSDKIVLKMYRAQEVTDGQAPEVYDMVRELARRAQLPMPRVYIIPQEAPNAFATGRNPQHAVVAVTQGLLRLMDREEVMGVLAHEMAHVKNRDILIGSIAATMAGAIMILGSMARFAAIFGGGRSDDDEGGGIVGLIVMAVLAPLAAVIIQMAISRSREYLADATGAGFAGYPEGLARALEKLGQYSKQLPMHAGGAASRATAHMFIVNPFSGRSLKSLFSTHPPLEERIARLRGNRPAKQKDESGRPGREADARAMWDRLSE